MPKQSKAVQKSTEQFRKIMINAQKIHGNIAEKRRSEAKSLPDDLGNFQMGPMEQPTEEMIS